MHTQDSTYHRTVVDYAHEIPKSCIPKPLQEWHHFVQGNVFFNIFNIICQVYNTNNELHYENYSIQYNITYCLQLTHLR